MSKSPAKYPVLLFIDTARTAEQLKVPVTESKIPETLAEVYQTLEGLTSVHFNFGQLSCQGNSTNPVLASLLLVTVTVNRKQNLKALNALVPVVMKELGLRESQIDIVFGQVQMNNLGFMGKVNNAGAAAKSGDTCDNDDEGDNNDLNDETVLVKVITNIPAYLLNTDCNESNIAQTIADVYGIQKEKVAIQGSVDQTILWEGKQQSAAIIQIAAPWVNKSKNNEMTKVLSPVIEKELGISGYRYVIWFVQTKPGTVIGPKPEEED